MRGPGYLILVSCLLAAWVTIDLTRTLKTGRAHGRFAVFTLKKQPARFWRYVYANYVVLALCFAAVCWAVFWPDSFR